MGADIFSTERCDKCGLPILHDDNFELKKLKDIGLCLPCFRKEDFYYPHVKRTVEELKALAETLRRA
jgi:hypothetical protein